MTAVVIIEGLVILLLAILVAGLLKSHAEILRQLHALGVEEDGTVSVGSARTRPKTTGFEQAPSPTLVGQDLEGATRTISLTHGRGNTLIAFLSSGCLSCRTFWDAFDGDFDLPTPDTRTVIVTKGPAAESPGKLAELAPAGLPLIMSDDTWDTFRVPMTPYFMLVDGHGMVIGEGAASSWQHLLGLLRQSFDDAARIGSGSSPNDESLLGEAGIEPGDPSLYASPTEER